MVNKILFVFVYLMLNRKTCTAHHLIVMALKKAQEAVASDTANEILTAFFQYEDCLSILQSNEINKYPFSSAEKKKLNDHISVYSERLKIIVRMLPDKSTYQTFPEWKFAPIHNERMSDFEARPTVQQSSHQVLFWALRTLRKSIVTGGKLTRRLYVSPDIWTNNNEMDDKNSFFEMLIKSIERLKDDISAKTIPTKSLENYLDEFLKKVESYKRSKATSYERLKESSSKKKLSFPSSTSLSSQKYTSLLGRLCEEAQFFEKISLTANNDINEILAKIMIIFEQIISASIQEYKNLSLKYLKENNLELIKF